MPWYRVSSAPIPLRRVPIVVVRSWVDADACVAERARPLAVPVGLAEAHRAHGSERVRLDADFREVIVVVAAARVLALEALDYLACWRRRRDLGRGALGLSRLRDGHAGDGSGQGELGCEEEERAQGGDRVEEGLSGRLVRWVLVAKANGMDKHERGICWPCRPMMEGKLDLLS